MQLCCLYIKAVNGEHFVHATDAKLVRVADTQYLLQEMCLQGFALLPQLFCSNVLFILLALLQRSVPPLDAPG